MKSEKFYTIDFFRILFTIGVIFGHTYCNFFQQQWMKTHAEDLVSLHNMCVDAFFVISGIFMASYCEKRRSIEVKGVFKNYQISRLKRLWPSVAFVAIVMMIIKLVQQNVDSFADFVNCWPTFFLIGNINSIPGANNGFWYISVLFWVGWIISGLLIFFEKMSKYILLPLMILISFSLMYAVFGSLNLGNRPLIFGFFSAGIFRGICGLALGVELFCLAEYLKEHVVATAWKSKLIFVVVEILSTLGIIYCFTRGGCRRTDFIIYPCWALLCLVFLMRKEVIFAFVNNNVFKKIIQWLSKYTFMVYLTHFIMVENFLKQWIDINKINCVLVYLIVIVISFVFGIIMYYLEKIFEKMIYGILKNVSKPFRTEG